MEGTKGRVVSSSEEATYELPGCNHFELWLSHANLAAPGQDLNHAPEFSRMLASRPAMLVEITAHDRVEGHEHSRIGTLVRGPPRC